MLPKFFLFLYFYSLTVIGILFVENNLSFVVRYLEGRSNQPSDGESPDHEVDGNLVFEAALVKYGSRKCFMLGLFLLCTSPGILNGFHVMVYVFLGQTPKHWCAVPILVNAGWTPEQIRNISSPK